MLQNNRTNHNYGDFHTRGVNMTYFNSQLQRRKISVLVETIIIITFFLVPWHWRKYPRATSSETNLPRDQRTLVIITF